MKGGITSGVIYPLALVELAQKYQFRSIGGASAGAIAAAAAAAAQYAKNTGSTRAGSGFVGGLSELPKQISEELPGGGTRLLSLFQPTPDAEPLFAVLLKALAAEGAWGKLSAALTVFAVCLDLAPGAWLLSAVTTLLLVLSTLNSAAPNWLSLVLALVALVGFAVAWSLVVLVKHALKATSVENRFGLCAGYSRRAEHDRSRPAPLTVWLSRLINRLAGLDEDGPALTCGELAQKGITVEVMTTNLTFGRPFRLPLRDNYANTFFMRVSDLRDLFPQNVLDVMGCDLGKAEHEYVPFPSAKNLPVVMAARMSLSFPVLLQQVPAYACDRTRKAQADKRELDRCWFGDGGICSNLPLHFFDSLLPVRPTFALNLKPPHPDFLVPEELKDQGDQGQYVHVADSNGSGINHLWNRFDQKGGIVSFLATMIDTMQNWNDHLTAIHPGYRDRIAHISHNQKEGGLNLNMPPEVIENLARRGKAAGLRLGEQFTQKRYPESDPKHTGWANHLWVRYRTLVAMLSGEVKDLQGFDALKELYDDPPSYRFKTDADSEAAKRVNERLIALAQQLENEKEALTGEGTPSPLGELKGRPQG